MVNWQIGITLEQLEREVILKALKYFNNNKTHTANALGIAIRTIDNKLEKYSQEDLVLEQRIREREEKAYALLQAQRGLPVEPVDESSEKHGMHLRKQEEVQKVLPPNNAEGDASKRVRRSNKE